MKMAREYCRWLKWQNPDWCIINPLDNNRYMHKCDYQHDDYMDIDLSILEKCDAIVMCGEWENSVGCTELWQQLKDMDNRAYNQFRPDYSVQQLEEKFKREDQKDLL